MHSFSKSISVHRFLDKLAAMNQPGGSFLRSAPSLFQEQAPLMVTPIIPVEAHLLTQPGTDGQVRQPEVVAGVY